MIRTTTLLATLSTTLMVGSALAAPVVVTNSALEDAGLSQVGITTSTTFSAMNLDGGNTVVALVSWEQSGGNAGTVSATYGAAAMTGVSTTVTSASNQQYAAVFYLIGATSGQDLVISTTDGSGKLYVSAVALGNVDAVFDSATGTGTGSGTSIGLSYASAADGLSVLAFVDNTSNNPGGAGGAAPTIHEDSEYIDTVIAAVGSGSGDDSSASLHAFGGTVADATAFDQITEGTNQFSSSREAAALVNFSAVPEPGSLALFGLGGLCVLRRRRG